ncbi:hypothetical protein ERJ75_001584700 [Trypanosoma vivax]|uniref:Uncharacterized protein n=1 Tax=Trypanosoma vivax (strain Y486) TaxID=1055687 RepID=F9WNK9_TRYVY|nr:hypothetical protein ERJ75_001584700 [Trypanosoma vivax]CCD19127.1 hypothetical protein, conserved in T.vivax [Trypanosoma vivax Y486]|eukprot:CCD19127.1 hypothetical protein, conserved in T.vivax [Trypanosoma vivax Y486]
MKANIIACEVTEKTAHGVNRHKRDGLHLHNCNWPANGSKNVDVRCEHEGQSAHFTGCSDADPKGIIFANCTAKETHLMFIDDDHSKIFDLICLNCPFGLNRTIGGTVSHDKKHFVQGSCQQAFDVARNISTESKTTNKSAREDPSTVSIEEVDNKTDVNVTRNGQSSDKPTEGRDVSNNLKSAITDSIKGAQLNESSFNMTLPTWSVDGLRSSAAKQSAPLSVAGICLLRHLSP